MALECTICFDALIDPEAEAPKNVNPDEFDDDEDFTPPPPDRTPVLTRCGHMYHNNCLQAWLSTKANARQRSCPQCREKLAKRDLTVMNLKMQQIATEKAKAKTQAHSEKLGVTTNNPAKPGQKHGGQCFNEEAHQKLSKDYEAISKTYEQLKNEVALIKGEIASLQTLVKEQEKRIDQQCKQGTKRKIGDVDEE